MFRSTCLVVLFLALALPGLAQGDYRYYEVRSGDTVESVARSHGLDPDTVLRCNARQVLEGQGLTPGAILVLPLPAKPAEKPLAKPAEKPLAKASPARPARPRPAPATGRAGISGSVVAVEGRPAFTNRYVTSDGRTVVIPTWEPPVEPGEEEAALPGRSTLASRSGRPVRGVLAVAQRFLGVPYVWGGEDPSGFDCSGYVQYVFRMHGVQLPRTADVQFQAGRVVPRGQEQPGDLVFFETYAPGASHVGIYLGHGTFIHASSVGFVRISSLSEDYFQSRYLGARRVL